MSLCRILTFMVVIIGLIASGSRAQPIVPSALLTIDQNRSTVVDRIVNQWGDALARSNVGISTAQLREILSGLRSDHLLAASLAGSIEGLRDVVSGALVRTDASVSPTLMHTKSLGDTTDDLVYTPVVPCRIVDTRSGGGGVFLPGNQRDWLAYSATGFAAQGGSATNCGIPVRPVAIMANTTLANTVGGPEFFTLWPFNQARPNASTVNWWASAQQPANAEVVPLCTGGFCTSDFSAYASGQTHAIIDVLGYFNRPTNYGGTHVITGVYATDSGGFNNTASGPYSTVGGGLANSASGPSSTIAGGNTNQASGDFSAVGGGISNIASGGESTVAGGQANAASSNYSTVAGGAVNTASGSGSTVVGGALNTASGQGSAVAGGNSNIASGVGSFAAGWRALTQSADNPPVVHDGTFVFSDFSNFNLNFNTAASNEFAVRATGGVRFVTAIDGSGAPTWTCGVSGGSGGSWGCSSDRNLKTSLVSLDGVATLERLAALPVYRWFARDDVRKIPHVGPMAQDFMAAFGLGDNDKMIGFADAQGVAFAAIQGLHQMMQQKDAKLQQQSREIFALKRKLQAIEAKLGI